MDPVEIFLRQADENKLNECVMRVDAGEDVYSRLSEPLRTRTTVLCMKEAAAAAAAAAGEAPEASHRTCCTAPVAVRKYFQNLKVYRGVWDARPNFSERFANVERIEDLVLPNHADVARDGLVLESMPRLQLLRIAETGLPTGGGSPGIRLAVEACPRLACIDNHTDQAWSTVRLVNLPALETVTPVRRAQTVTVKNCGKLATLQVLEAREVVVDGAASLKVLQVGSAGCTRRTSIDRLYVYGCPSLHTLAIDGCVDLQDTNRRVRVHVTSLRHFTVSGTLMGEKENVVRFLTELFSKNAGLQEIRIGANRVFTRTRPITVELAKRDDDEDQQQKEPGNTYNQPRPPR
jgi:hypothetical protein